MSSIILMAIVIGFVLIIDGCSSLQDRKNFRHDCSVECADCKDFKMHCDSHLKSNKEGEDKGVNIINDLGGLMK